MGIRIRVSAAADIESRAVKRTAEWRIIKKWAGDGLKSRIAKRGDKGLLASTIFFGLQVTKGLLRCPVSSPVRLGFGGAEDRRLN